MATAAISYTCTALLGVNKKGKLQCDPDGYYDVVLGALNYYNQTGAFYALEPARKLLENDSSILQRRIKKGVLNGEYKHPERSPGMSDKDFLLRNLRIDEAMVSHHIKEVYLDRESMRDSNGSPIIIVRGRVKPKGPYGQYLADSLENPNENTYFSVRSITEDFLDTATGDIVKETLEIVTWDHVTEGGIDIACKYSTPSLEMIQEHRFTKDVVIMAKNAALASSSISNEDDRSAILSLAAHMEKRPASGLYLPPSASW